MLHDQMLSLYKGFPPRCHRWRSWCRSSAPWAAFYPEGSEVADAKQREISMFRLLAKVPTVAAWSYKYNKGEPFIYPQNHMGYAENFLHMLHANPCEKYEPSPVLARALDRIFILHADHEQNASTSTVRMAGSSFANPFACIAAGTACLWAAAWWRQRGGADHAGANGRRVAHWRVRQSRQGQDLWLPSDGLWSPRLQEHGPARGDHAPDLS